MDELGGPGGERNRGMWKRLIAAAAVVALAALMLSGCSSGGGKQTLTVITHDSFNISKPLLEQFEKDNNVTVKLVPKGDAGQMLASLILTKSNPEGDVAFGVDNTFLSRALNAGIFEKYTSPELKNVPQDLQAETDGYVTPVDYGYVNFNYDIAWFQKHNLQPPQTLEDLAKPEYKGLTVVENPGSSSPGLCLLVATVGYFGPDHYLDWWTAMRANGMKVVDSWDTAYNVNFTLHGGAQPIVLSYATSTAYEQMAAKPPRNDSPTGNILPPKGAFKQIEYVGILKGTKHEALAKKWIDFELSVAAQEDEPGQMAVYPVVSGAKVPEAFTKFSTVDPSAAANVSAADIAKNRDAWIAAWTKAVLQ
ncbi:MAG TPA: thiamine ABC transporter substrate-binding protein [Tepidiformaceae bacterium]|nr:thiamine ABC transporter substrate-binding protein [Tepidiformaceae bacterium]